MTPLQMAEESAKAMATPGTIGVVLTIPKGKLPKGFPRGELLNEMERGGTVLRTYHFDPAKVLAWLIHNKLVIMNRTNSTTITFSNPTP